MLWYHVDGGAALTLVASLLMVSVGIYMFERFPLVVQEVKSYAL